MLITLVIRYISTQQCKKCYVVGNSCTCTCIRRETHVYTGSKRELDSSIPAPDPVPGRTEESVRDRLGQKGVVRTRA